MRYLDIASPFGNFSPSNDPAPTKYLTYELGVHGWPRVYWKLTQLMAYPTTP
jgi:hypothetical protein